MTTSPPATECSQGGPAVDRWGRAAAEALEKIKASEGEK
jgi:hypothetical protein